MKKIYKVPVILSVITVITGCNSKINTYDMKPTISQSCDKEGNNRSKNILSFNNSLGIINGIEDLKTAEILLNEIPAGIRNKHLFDTPLFFLRFDGLEENNSEIYLKVIESSHLQFYDRTFMECDHYEKAPNSSFTHFEAINFFEEIEVIDEKILKVIDEISLLRKLGSFSLECFLHKNNISANNLIQAEKIGIDILNIYTEIVSLEELLYNTKFSSKHQIHNFGKSEKGFLEPLINALKNDVSTISKEIQNCNVKDTELCEIQDTYISFDYVERIRNLGKILENLHEICSLENDLIKLKEKSENHSKYINDNKDIVFDITWSKVYVKRYTDTFEILVSDPKDLYDIKLSIHKMDVFDKVNMK